MNKITLNNDPKIIKKYILENINYLNNYDMKELLNEELLFVIKNDNNCIGMVIFFESEIKEVVKIKLLYLILDSFYVDFISLLFDNSVKKYIF